MQMADAINQTTVQGLATGPEGAGEHLRFIALELASAAFAHQGLEGAVDIGLEGQKTVNIFLLLGLEGIEDGFVFTSGVNAAFNAQLAEGFDKTEACRNDANGADQRRALRHDMVRRQSREIGAGRAEEGEGDGRPGNPGGGAHELQFDNRGNVIIGMGNGTVKYEPKTGKFTPWAAGKNMFGLDADGNVWYVPKNGVLAMLDTSSEALKQTLFEIPKNKGIYDMDTDSKGRTDLYIWRDSKIGHFDPQTKQYSEYQTPTPMSGPRRGQIDSQDRLWTTEFYAGQVAMFDPDKKLIKEYPLINGAKPYTAPYAEPYSASVDSKNKIVWTNDFSSSRLYRIDIESGHSTEYLTPSNYEMRDLKVDPTAPRPTVWIPAYRPPAKIVKIEVR